MSRESLNQSISNLSILDRVKILKVLAEFTQNKKAFYLVKPNMEDIETDELGKVLEECQSKLPDNVNFLEILKEFLS